MYIYIAFFGSRHICFLVKSRTGNHVSSGKSTNVITCARFLLKANVATDESNGLNKT